MHYAPMTTFRSVVRLHPAIRDDIADLVTRRPLPNPRLAGLDPFLFLNHHEPQTYPPNNHGLPFGPHDAVVLGADQDAVVLLGHADPIGEPVVAHGPFVMNTQDEIVQAIRDYQAGKFGGLD